jgi:hypothetical protein
LGGRAGAAVEAVVVAGVAARVGAWGGVMLGWAKVMS